MIVGTLGQAAIRTLLVVVCISITVHIAAIRRNTEAIRRWRCMVAQLAAALLGVIVPDLVARHGEQLVSLRG